ncbi:NAD-dependent epimerase/dehydratase family protein [Geomonas sp. RF6]|uniref:NAD-dependent epimerase/dehydratase family protein n=1 Tax=Geomonas sp. RF6 TaxID=2897342 RepID=UPI001E4CE8D2|nr:NAD-dependent epimerase/dehydratase family protein [Geomonas sp. RF6]UFS69391.1 NAD-dependent epimerase/dehydratase family protein [Geomonas sp. RF6]
MQQVVIAGCGRIGTRVARLWRERGATVTCMVRSPEHQAALENDGFLVHRCSFDEASDLTLPQMEGTVLYYFVPPPGGGFSDTRARNFCSALISADAPPATIVYISATSVYSETRGGVVTESSPTDPPSAMGKRRLDAEDAFRGYAAASGAALVILRVSGIYGPEMLPLMQIRQGQPLLREADAGPSNRIHADDLAQICVTAAEKGSDGDIFNVSDGNPSSITAYFNACADALGEPRQPQVSLTEARQVLSPLMYSYVSETRIVDNTAMIERLGVTLRYPTLQEGLRASVAERLG